MKAKIMCQVKQSTQFLKVIKKSVNKEDFKLITLLANGNTPPGSLYYLTMPIYFLYHVGTLKVHVVFLDKNPPLGNWNQSKWARQAILHWPNILSHFLLRYISVGSKAIVVVQAFPSKNSSASSILHSLTLFNTDPCVFIYLCKQYFCICILTKCHLFW